jgi:hypothetical protein
MINMRFPLGYIAYLTVLALIGCASYNLQPAAQSKKMAWDEFNHRTNMVWSCREIDTGKFVSRSMCATLPKEDTVWPDKRVPDDYMGD